MQQKYSHIKINHFEIPNNTSMNAKIKENGK